MKNLISGLLVFGLTTQFIFSKIIDSTCVNEAKEIIRVETINPNGVTYPIKFLEEKVISIYLMESILLSDEKGVFIIAFNLPEGRFDKLHTTEVKLLHTDEKIKMYSSKKKMLYNNIFTTLLT